MNESTGAARTIESASDFKDDKAGQWKKWEAELNAAQAAVRKYHRMGHKTVAKYLNDAKASEFHAFKLNIFHSNIKTVKAMMFGKLPEITFSRTNGDFNDDAARVAGMMLQRMLNADIGTPNDLYSQALKKNLEDRLLPGLGVSRVRYEFDEETVQVAAVIDQQSGVEIEAASTQTQITNERAPVDYVFWKDFLWSPARTWEEVRWVGFKTLMTRDEMVARFGEKLGKKIQLTASKIDASESIEDQNELRQDAYMRGVVWEVWDKETKQICWWSSSVETVLDKKDDPLQLTGFFPIPEPMTANVTTSAYMPIPDYIMAQDLYSEIDQLETRISKITEAVKVVGVYDQSAEGVKRMLTEGVENDLIPVDNWAMFAEKGGLQGTIDWLPVKEIAETLGYLIERRNDVKGQLYEISGISDIMRGAQASSGGPVSATERSLEARFSSVRIQELQDQFATYATDLIRLRAEVVSRHFQPESIVKQSNIESTPDTELIGPAVEMIKNSQSLIWRIQVKPESVAMVDYAQLKEERTSYMTAVATFLQSSAPIMEMSPQAAPILMEMLKWGLAGFKGSNEIEGVLDKAIEIMQQPAPQEEQPEPPSPEEIKAQMEQAKQAHEVQMKEMDAQFEQSKMQAEAVAEEQTASIRMQEIQAENTAKIQQEEAQAILNMQEQEKESEEIMKRETHKANETIRVNAAKPQPRAASSND